MYCNQAPPASACHGAQAASVEHAVGTAYAGFLGGSSGVLQALELVLWGLAEPGRQRSGVPQREASPAPMDTRPEALGQSLARPWSHGRV